MTIKSIDMYNQPIQYATIKKLNDLYTKMRQTPIVENNYSPDLCTKGKNSYIMGHSEPSYLGEKGDGLYAFSRLEEVEIGDIIKVTNVQGKTNTYIMFKSPIELGIIALIAFLFFGANKLPEAARSIGQSFRILKDEINSVKESSIAKKPNTKYNSTSFGG